MDKTERLFGVMDALRRHRHPVTAATLAAEQGVSLRTMYRDVQTLIGLGAPIDGEAGIGYLLRPGFFMPPLMFSPEELEALVLGAHWVQRQPDDTLAAAARNALGKIATASPEDLRHRISDTGLWAAGLWPRADTPRPPLALIRAAMRNERSLLIHYRDEGGMTSERLICPVQLAYYDGKQVIAAWCCLREAFRNFRTDRLVDVVQSDQRYVRRRAALSNEWRREWDRAHPEWAGIVRPDIGGATS